jgi:hypothetical protein
MNGPQMNPKDKSYFFLIHFKFAQIFEKDNKPSMPETPDTVSGVADSADTESTVSKKGKC